MLLWTTIDSSNVLDTLRILLDFFSFVSTSRRNQQSVSSSHVVQRRTALAKPWHFWCVCTAAGPVWTMRGATRSSLCRWNLLKLRRGKPNNGHPLHIGWFRSRNASTGSTGQGQVGQVGQVRQVGLWELLEYNAHCFNPHRMASLLALVLEEPRSSPSWARRDLTWAYWSYCKWWVYSYVCIGNPWIIPQVVKISGYVMCKSLAYAQIFHDFGKQKSPKGRSLGPNVRPGSSIGPTATCLFAEGLGSWSMIWHLTVSSIGELNGMEWSWRRIVRNEKPPIDTNYICIS
jgi:hypothetical protein